MSEEAASKEGLKQETAKRTSVYDCPCCGERILNPLTKAFAGSIRTKGTICPKCGKRITNGMGSAIFHTVVDLIALIASVIFYVFDIGFELEIGGSILRGSYLSIIICLAAAFVINKIFDAFFLKTTETLRTDAYIS